MTNSVYKSNRCPGCNRRGGKHKETCVFIVGIENIDYVKCSICSYKAKSLSQHIRLAHRITLENYQGEVMATNTKTAYSKGNSGRDNWVKTLKFSNPQLADLLIKNMAQKVSARILANPQEIDRRSESMKNLWKKHEAYFRKVASETATRTSQRQDILDKRTEILRKWREENPHVFYERCTVPMIKLRSSKPEKFLLKYLQETYPDFEFKGGQTLFRTRFTTKSSRRQIDIFSRKKGIIIEFDGPIHFKNIPSWNQLEEVQKRDNEVNEVLKMEYAVIRVGYDQWHRTKGFNSSCLEELKIVFREPEMYRTKITKIGRHYI